jgi:hypothetical protein
MPPELEPAIPRPVLPPDLGQDLLDEEVRVAGAEAIVFVAAVVARHLVRAGRRHDAGVDQDRDGDGHRALLDEVVQHDWQAPCSSFRGEARAVLEDHHACGFCRVVLRRNVHPVVAGGAGEYLRGFPGVLCNFAFGDAIVRLRIGTERILRGKRLHQSKSERKDLHRADIISGIDLL